MSQMDSTLDTLLSASAATEEFKQAVRDVAHGHSSPHVRFSRNAPVVKVLRVICKLLAEEPTLAVSDVEVSGRSGCSDFVGTLLVNAGEREYGFEWNCRWKAEQEGMRDSWGGPDSTGAARAFGYQCFRRFERTR